MKTLPFFVYGTLLPGQPNHYLWAPHIVHNRTAIFINAWLYDMGGFPMLIEGRKGLVKGLVVDVRPEKYAAILARLDQLEGIRPDKRPDDAPYRRAARHVVTERGAIVESWVYLGHPDFVVGQEWIPAGDWSQHTKTRREQLKDFWQQKYGPGL